MKSDELKDQRHQRVAAIQRHGQRLVGLRPGDAFGDAQVGDVRVALADGLLARGVDFHAGHQRGRIPGLQQGLGQQQMSGGARMYAIGNHLGGVGCVGGIGLLQGFHHRGVDVRQAELLVGASCFRKSP